MKGREAPNMVSGRRNKHGSQRVSTCLLSSTRRHHNQDENRTRRTRQTSYGEGGGRMEGRVRRRRKVERVEGKGIKNRDDTRQRLLR